MSASVILSQRADRPAEEAGGDDGAEEACCGVAESVAEADPHLASGSHHDI